MKSYKITYIHIKTANKRRPQKITERTTTIIASSPGSAKTRLLMTFDKVCRNRIIIQSVVEPLQPKKKRLLERLFPAMVAK